MWRPGRTVPTSAEEGGMIDVSRSCLFHLSWPQVGLCRKHGLVLAEAWEEMCVCVGGGVPPFWNKDRAA